MHKLINGTKRIENSKPHKGGLQFGTHHKLPLRAACLLLFLLPVFSQVSAQQFPELVIQTGPASIHTLVLSPDNRLLASAGIGNAIVLLDAKTGTHLRTIYANSAFVNSIAFSPDSRTLVSADASGGRGKSVLELWEVMSGKKIREFEGHVGRIVSVAFNPDGKTFASSGWSDRTIKIWEVATGRLIQTLTEKPGMLDQIIGTAIGTMATANVVLPENSSGATWSMTYSPDGQMLASAGENSSVILWDAVSGKKLHKLSKHSKDVLCVAFSPDGGALASGSLDNTVRIWDAKKGKLLNTLTGHQDAVLSVKFSVDGRKLVSGSKDSSLKFWDSKTGRELSTVKKDGEKVGGIAIYPDGKTMATSNTYGRITLWDLESNDKIGTFTSKNNLVQTAKFSQDGTRVAIGYGSDQEDSQNLKIWGRNGDELITLRGSTKAVNSIEFSRTGKFIAGAGTDKDVHVWDADSGTEKFRFKGHNSIINVVAFSPDGKYLASGSGRPENFAKTLGIDSGNDNSARLWNLQTGTEARLIGKHSFPVFCVAFTPDNRLIATAENFLGLKDVKLIEEMKKLSAIKLWDINTNNLVATLEGHTLPVKTLALSPDGKLAASAAWDRTLIIWDFLNARKLHEIARKANINSVAFSPNGQILAAGSSDNSVLLLNPLTGTEIRVLKGHEASVTSVAFSPDGKLLVSASFDGTTRIWELASGKELAKLVDIDQDDWLVTTPDGFFDGSSSAWNQILWRFSGETFNVVPVESFFNEFYFPGLLQELLEGKRPKARTEMAQLDRRQPELTISTDIPVQNFRRVEQRLVKLKVNVSKAPAGAKDVRLFRNGALVKVWRGNVLPNGRTEIDLEATVPIVAGENVFTAYAFNRDSIKSTDAALTLTGTKTLERRGKMYILAVGINKYANPQYNLKYAVADAQAFGADLQKQQTKLNRFSDIEVIPLPDADATKSNILLAIGLLAGKPAKNLPDSLKVLFGKLQASQPEDAVVIYFAGHGTAQQNRFYLIPHDLGYQGARNQLNRNSLQSILSNSISDLDLEAALEGVDAQNLLLVIDACNSGQALEAEEKRRGPMNSKGLAQLAYEKGMYILTAAQSYQSALEASQLGHGFLTYALIEEGLKMKKADTQPVDGQILTREWFNYAVSRVPMLQQDLSLRSKVEPTIVEKNPRKRQLKQNTASKNSQPDVPGQNAQQPRIFYRREKEKVPLIIATP